MIDSFGLPVFFFLLELLISVEPQWLTAACSVRVLGPHIITRNMLSHR